MGKHEDIAQISGAGEFRRIEVSRVARAPIERVWTAITDQREVSQWWAAATIDAREGGRIHLLEQGEDCGPDAPPLDGEIKVFLPPHVFEFTWNDDTVPAKGLVRFDLIALGDDETRITIINLVERTDLMVTAIGWHLIADNVVKYIASGGPVPDPGDARNRELYALYQPIVDAQMS